MGKNQSNIQSTTSNDPEAFEGHLESYIKNADSIGEKIAKTLASIRSMSRETSETTFSESSAPAKQAQDSDKAHWTEITDKTQGKTQELSKMLQALEKNRQIAEWPDKEYWADQGEAHRIERLRSDLKAKVTVLELEFVELQGHLSTISRLRNLQRQP